MHQNELTDESKDSVEIVWSRKPDSKINSKVALISEISELANMKCVVIYM
jgi:hypothetical protein